MNQDLSKMMEQLQNMQEQLARTQDELASLTTTAESGGGMVKVTANGRQQIISISIEKEVVSAEEKEMLEDLIVAAVNRVLDQSRELSESKMNDAARGFMPNLPGMGI
jgi:DNA-binding YbaB/EbfC family protein